MSPNEYLKKEVDVSRSNSTGPEHSTKGVREIRTLAIYKHRHSSGVQTISYHPLTPGAADQLQVCSMYVTIKGGACSKANSPEEE